MNVVTAVRLREFADALDKDRAHGKSMVTRIMREAADENERLRTGLDAIAGLAQSPSWEIAHDALQGKFHPPSDEGKAPAAAGNRQGRSETGDGPISSRLGINWRIELRREIERARKGGYLIELSPDLLGVLLDYYEGGGFSTREPKQ